MRHIGSAAFCDSVRSKSRSSAMTRPIACYVENIARRLSCRTMSRLTRRTFLAAAGTAALSRFAWSRAASKVKVGVCTSDIAGAVKYGFDYIEPAAADIAAMTEDKFQQFSDQVLSSPIRCEAFNSLIRRPELVVLGNE